jgi:hypothetical protein
MVRTREGGDGSMDRAGVVQCGDAVVSAFVAMMTSAAVVDRLVVIVAAAR